jgi:hypothetical protein
MSQWNPIWKLEINGVDYTNLILSNLTITSGRTDIYSQANAGYCNIELINLDQTNYTFAINESISISVQDSTATFVPIFGGTITDLTISVSEIGSVAYAQTYTMIALGALSRLPRIITTGILPHEFDGDQIYRVLSEILFNQWQQVPAAETWATYSPAGQQWQNAENNGLGEIDQPGDYDLAARSSSVIDVYSLVAGRATSGLGQIGEDASGRIFYADSTHRSQYLSANGYVDLDANHANAKNLQIRTRSGDVRNSITLKYGANSNNEVTDSDPASIALYGNLSQIINTTLHNQADATIQAEFYLELRAYPNAQFNQFAFDLTNPEIDDADRDALINTFMGQPLRVSNLPLNMNSGEFLGFVEGWTFSAAYNELSLTMNVSPLAFSLQAFRWENVPIVEQWQDVSATLDWANATIL